MIKINKDTVKYVRIIAVVLSVIMATLTLCNIVSAATQSIEFEIPEEDDFKWAIDPVEKEVIFITNFTIKNHGFYDINDIDINAALFTEDGNTIIDFEQQDLVVSKGSEKTFEVMVTLQLEKISLKEWFKLLYDDSIFTLIIDIDVDYMFGLIHVTVDEKLEYYWEAPLSQYFGDDEIISNIRTILSIAESSINHEFNTIEKTMVEYLTHIGSFEYFTDEGYEFLFNIIGISEGLKKMICSIQLPINEIEGTLTIGFSFIVEIENFRIELQKVSVEYVSE